ncbi:MAG: hypothetical protein COS82_01775 [Zetaproteobacteria bacterium CG06_land_8_20_14_3_00_59_53]|nr:MAG: hypothetical protein AUK36_10610 [Zetaproteobacteria bacterium CG2_30_59_37]PIO90222.1 MAG: hypothetical protein COX56_03460 [Zetaproteobacteria bacterium CG23_combo_of_CG06-09_8_20_14_all_59_86]PIQ64569.1 MAG: hypothetical protein COV97_08315 [Zetaproteobacteria bacterium CG11_big_fil_rev_8_21_14_0_20_59_439]PIU71269.1 MAG: hypothetical protein COS82_01775 [Zetaproteobacteria bacterium CG06_land_8_20_14_3_00_59_53]PIU97204.1 MAG: hypothetical protein COS62_04770 [Zetaproteobacteria bac
MGMPKEKPLTSVSRLFGPLLVLLLLVASTTANKHLTANRAAGEETRMHLPQGVWLDAMALGYRNLFAETLWIRTLSWFGAHVRDADYSYLGGLLAAIAQLNPRAEHAYYMAGAVLPWNTGSTLLSRPLLEKAMLAFPQDWRWPYYRGFNAYWFDHDKAESGRLLAQAAGLHGAPQLVMSLALRMQASAGELQTALLFVEQLLKEQQDSNIRSQLEHLRADILTEQIMRTLDTRLAGLPQRFHDARDVQQLRDAGLSLPAILPDGGHIVMSDKGEPVSSVSGKRFRVFVPPAREGAGE